MNECDILLIFLGFVILGSFFFAKAKTRKTFDRPEPDTISPSER